MNRPEIDDDDGQRLLRMVRRGTGSVVTSEIAYTPTDSSWLNRIEAQFTALRHFAGRTPPDPRRQRLSRVVRAGSVAHSSLRSGT